MFSIAAWNFLYHFLVTYLYREFITIILAELHDFVEDVEIILRIDQKRNFIFVTFAILTLTHSFFHDK